MRQLYGTGLAFIAFFALFCCNLQAADFTLSSPQIKEGSALSSNQVFNSFGCTGQNISPELAWSNPPQGTKSFAVTMYDPDAPTGSGWWHWVLFNIPPTVTKLEAGAGSTQPQLLPKGSIQGTTDFGKPGYGGPCPPEGDKPHHYRIRVFALKDTLPLNSKTPAAQVGFYLNKNKLAEAEINGTYGR